MLGSTILCAGVWSIYGAIFYPGIISWDFYVQWHQATGKIPFSDWHPLFHTLLIWLATRVWHSPAIVSLAQIAAMAVLVGMAAVRLDRAGAPRRVILVMVLFYALFPLNGLYAVSLWKDIAYAIALFWLTLLIADAALSRGKALDNRRFQAALLIALFCVAMTRHNGLVPAYGTLLALLVIFYRRARTIVGVAASLAILILLFKGPLFTRLQVDVTEKNVLKAHLPIQHIGAVLRSGGEISPAESEILAQVMPLAYWQKAYDPRSCMPLIFGKGKDGVPHLRGDFLKSEANYGRFLQAWMRIVLQNPRAILNYHATGSELLWRIRVGYPQFVIANEDLLEEHLYSGYKPSQILHDRVGPAGRFLIRLINDPSLGWLLHRGALYFWLSLLVLNLTALRSKKSMVLLIAAPMLWQALTLAAFPLVQDTRFMYPIILIAPLLIALFFSSFGRGGIAREQYASCSLSTRISNSGGPLERLVANRREAGGSGHP